jgi:ubiquinone/menaquinone biosynthesis C-methylase UbiE
MKTWISDKKAVEAQYSRANNFSKRVQIHQYSVNPQGWLPFIVSKIRVDDSDTVLDIGCGTADFWKYAIENGVKVKHLVLSDLSDGMLAKARERLLEHTSFPVEFRRFDAASIPYPDNSFDVVVANHVLYHVENVETTIREIVRVLKCGGRFFGTTVGKMHMIELSNCAHKLVPEIPFPSMSIAERFGLENGQELLSKYFTTVKKHEHEDHLEVPGPVPLLEYIESVDNEGVLESEESRRGFLKRLEEEIDFSTSTLLD